MFIQNSIEKNFREITGKLALIMMTHPLLVEG